MSLVCSACGAVIELEPAVYCPGCGWTFVPVPGPAGPASVSAETASAGENAELKKELARTDPRWSKPI